MGKTYDEITPKLREFIEAQKMFFVASAPLAGDGLVNLSPKGYDTLRILDERRVAYLDLGGSGIETVAHLRENGRMVMMWCAFDGRPYIVRVHGRGTVHEKGSSGFAEHAHLFPELPGARSIIVLEAQRVSDSCGFAVPRYEYVEDRDTLLRYAEQLPPEKARDYRLEHNSRSLDGLPGLSPDFDAPPSQ